jgi:hypothetical protein
MFPNYLGFVTFEKNKHMKKLLFSLLFSVSFIYGYSQEYSFKRVFSDGLMLKLSGELSILDTSFILKHDGYGGGEYFVEGNLKKSDGELILGQFFNVRLGTTQQEIRFMMTKNTLKNNKGETYVFTFQGKDNFSNILTNMVYYLIPK